MKKGAANLFVLSCISGFFFSNRHSMQLVDEFNDDFLNTSNQLLLMLTHAIFFCSITIENELSHGGINRFQLAIFSIKSRTTEINTNHLWWSKTIERKLKTLVALYRWIKIFAKTNAWRSSVMNRLFLFRSRSFSRFDFCIAQCIALISNNRLQFDTKYSGKEWTIEISVKRQSWYKIDDAEWANDDRYDAVSYTNHLLSVSLTYSQSSQQYRALTTLQNSFQLKRKVFACFSTYK